MRSQRSFIVSIALIIFTSLAFLRADIPQQSWSPQYTIGPDDVLEITVLRPEKMSNIVTVGPDGTFSYPYIGTVRVRGTTLNQIQREIQSRLASGYLKYPEVAVALKESHSKKFYVSGAVLKPGSYPVDQNITVIKAISLAGGFVKNDFYGRIKIYRPRKNGAGNEILKINIKGMMHDSANESNIQLEPGDTLMVIEDKFYVYGAVVRPGTYPIEENVTVMKALSLVGGFTKYGSSNRVKILRPKNDRVGYHTIRVNMKGIMDGTDAKADLLIQPGDTVVVMEGLF